MALIRVLNTILKCLRCGHEWQPKRNRLSKDGIQDIRICPKCKSPYWDRSKSE